jgi:hypothetical protein
MPRCSVHTLQYLSILHNLGFLFLLLHVILRSNDYCYRNMHFGYMQYFQDV